MEICAICNSKFTRLASHITTIHEISYKEYYDIYIKTDMDGQCLVCNKPTKFTRTHYNKCCSQHCSAIYRNMLNKINHNNNVYEFEKTNNCTSTLSLRQLYGQGWYKANIIDNFLYAVIDSNMSFVHNTDIYKIIEYQNCISNKENSVKLFINSLNINYISNNRTIIAPYELDLYLPEYKIAIEYNGSWFHSFENNCSVEYHYTKSNLCREKGIRLIHIYEFEDINIQKELLYNLLILKKDLYGEDSNKNNIDFELKAPHLYLTDRHYHIYTVGPIIERRKNED